MEMPHGTAHFIVFEGVAKGQDGHNKRVAFAVAIDLPYLTDTALQRQAQLIQSLSDASQAPGIDFTIMATVNSGARFGNPLSKDLTSPTGSTGPRADLLNGFIDAQTGDFVPFWAMGLNIY